MIANFTQKIKYLPFLLLLLILSNDAFAEAFIIKDFNIHIQVNEQGILQVEETIKVDFSESKHGIIRKIPYKYTITEVDGEVARGRGKPGTGYTTYFRNFEVVDQPFENYQEGNYEVLRIGSPDDYVYGEMTYVIRYELYGALNYFSTHTELYWNLTGNEWATSMESVHFTIELPGEVTLSEEDVKLFTGSRFSTESVASWEYSGSEIKGKADRELTSYEGLTIAARLPKDMLPYTAVPLEVQANDYIVREFDCFLEVKENGSLVVNEYMDVEFLEPVYSFSRDLEYSSTFEDGSPAVFNYDFSPATRENWNIDNNGYGYNLNTNPDVGFFERNLIFTAEYTVYGATKNTEKGVEICWKPFGKGMGEPVAETSIKLLLPNGKIISPTGKWDVEGALEIENFEWTEQDTSGTILNLPPLNTSEQKRKLIAHFSPSLNSIEEPPARLFASSFFYDHYHILMKVRQDGSIFFKHELHVESLGREMGYYFSTEVPRKYWNSDKGYYYYDESYYQHYDLPNFRLFGGYYKPLVSKPTTNDDHYIYEYGGSWSIDWSDFGGRQFSNVPLTYEYEVTGLLSASGGPNTFPIAQPFDEPAENFSVRIEFEGNKIPKLHNSRVWLASGDETTAMELTVGPGMVAALPVSVKPGMEPFITLENPNQHMSFGTQFQLAWQNNFWLFLPLFFLFPLTLVWFLWGRDSKFTKMVRFHPPAQLSSAEAGLLVDGKVHDKDLISLIYYWCANGILKIKEINKKGGRKDYSLEKLRPLPSTAKGFEKLIFERLFRWSVGEKDTVNISTLRYSFAATLKMAKNELEDHAKKKGFFVKGSRGAGLLLKILGVVAGTAALVTFLLVISKFDSAFVERYDIPIGFVASGGVAFFFGLIMPKRAKYGAAQMEELEGFREFIKTAEKDRLEKLVNEDPEYFGNTLSYAVALGLAKEWAKKFEGLSMKKPDWYQGKTGDHFEPILFTQHVNRSMRQMSNDLTAVAAPSGGSSYSSGGSSYSSFGGSGGSSFSSSSSGGGYSGGGFGGGGGSSW